MHLQNCYVSSVYSQNVQNVNGEICNDTSDLVVFEHVANDLLKIFFSNEVSQVLGLQEKVISEAILSNGAFLIKGGEMQQIINHSIINYKAFFRWLYTAIMHVLDEQIPNEIPKMTQQDLAYITEFLQNFDRIGKNSKQNGFIMERLGQYLSDSNLTIQPDMSGNEWSHFLALDQCVQNHPSILKHFEEMSLIQQYKHLKTSIENIFAAPKDAITAQFEMVHVFDCFQYGAATLRTSQINVNKDAILSAFLEPPESVLLLQMQLPRNDCEVKCARLCFPLETLDDNYRVLDVKLYSSTVLTVLLQDKTPSKGTVLGQVQLGSALEKFTDVGGVYGGIFTDVVTINGSGLVPKLLKSVDGMVGAEFAVSGSRKVGIVLAENRRKVRLYEMEGEEEEDEDADMTNSTMKESDMSVQDVNISTTI
jgi:anaphase-promoting complex subunit 4